MKNPYKIYVFYTSIFVKIGVTIRDPEKRLKEVQTSCPLPIHRYSVISNLSKVKAYRYEKKIKEFLSVHHTFGEWYKYHLNIEKSISYLINSETMGKLVIQDFNTEHSKFEDLSVNFFLKIQVARRDKDLPYLSKLYSNILNEKHLQEDNKFLLYSREAILEIIKSSIGIVINYYKKNSIDVSKETTNELVSCYNKHYGIKKKKVVKKSSRKDFFKTHPFVGNSSYEELVDANK